MAGDIQEIWQAIGRHPLDHAGDYMDARRKCRSRGELAYFDEMLTWITSIQSTGTLSDNQLNALKQNFFVSQEGYDDLKKNGLPSLTSDSLEALINEAIAIKGGQLSKPTAAEIAGRFDTLAFDLKDCMGFGNHRDYAAICNAKPFTHHVGLINKILKGDQLSAAQLQQLIDFPNRVTDSRLAGLDGSRFLKDYSDKIVPQLEALKNMLPPLSEKEAELASVLEDFCREHAHALEAMAIKYRKLKQHEKVSPHLDQFLTLAGSLNCGPSMEDYYLDHDKLHATLHEIATNIKYSYQPVAHSAYATLISTPDHIQEAHDELDLNHLDRDMMALRQAKMDYSQLKIDDFTRKALQAVKDNLKGEGVAKT